MVEWAFIGTGGELPEARTEQGGRQVVATTVGMGRIDRVARVLQPCDLPGGVSFVT
jgi:hypothetical protein